MAARDPAQQGAAIQRRAQGAQQNFAQQLRFELGVQERFLHFLETFEAPDDAQEEGAEDLRKKTYADKARKMAQRGKDLLEVDWADLEAFDARLSEEIQRQFYVLQDFLVAALRPFIRSIEPDYVVDDMGKDKVFQLAFKGVHPHVQLRDLKTIEIGKLISIVGTVTRTGDVRPELISGTFLCLECRAEIRNVLQQFKYTQPISCTNPLCTNKSRFEPMLDQSKFIDFQKIKVQELSSEIPAGSMPRTIDIVLRGEIVETAKPGQMVNFSGTLIVVPDVAQMNSVGDRSEVVREAGARSAFGTNEGAVGLRALGVKELNYKMNFLANNVTVLGLSDGLDGEPAELSKTEQEEIKRMMGRRNLYQEVMQSVCPTVHGREDIKRGIALQMLGGVGKMTKDGIKLRGDINICIVGDPSTAKSQFLKYVSNFSPRAIYTSGKASSAAGLTASVVKDPETGEFGIEAGALMLADNSVCCIDEFDKMDIKDQVAIHEAMEQQTISIAKAGIQATLNARTSILAAANPRGGRYDNSKPLRLNVDITPPIMSRFDLFFILQDDCNEAVDKDIAQHLVRLHQRKQEAVTPPISKEELQRYFNYAKNHVHPKLTEGACQQLVAFYKELREGDGRSTSQSSYRITVRQLESMIRLSEALARLHLDKDVTLTHVVEAHRLMKALIIPVQQEPVVLDFPDEGGAGDGNDSDGGDEMRDSEQRQPDEDASSMQEAGAAIPPPPRRQPVAITFEKFKAIQSVIVREMRKRLDQGTDAERENGVRLGDLLDWYDAEFTDTGFDQSIGNRKFVALIIKRLVSNERALVINLLTDQPPANFEDTLLQLHPNMEN